jgi:hypothetical protein
MRRVTEIALFYLYILLPGNKWQARYRIQEQAAKAVPLLITPPEGQDTSNTMFSRPYSSNTEQSMKKGT